MVRANVPDDTVLDAIAETKNRIQSLVHWAPNDLSKDMTTSCTEWFDRYGQTWLDEFHYEIEEEKEVA